MQWRDFWRFAGIIALLSIFDAIAKAAFGWPINDMKTLIITAMVVIIWAIRDER